MNIELFRKDMSAEILMGPNSLRILEELFQRYPLQLSANDNILDLGCGKGQTSYAIAMETAATVYANDAGRRSIYVQKPIRMETNHWNPRQN